MNERTFATNRPSPRERAARPVTREASTTQTTQEQFYKRRRAAAGIATVALLGAGFGGYNSFANKQETPIPVSEEALAIHEASQVDNITELHIEDGARFRENPHVENGARDGLSNLLYEANLGDLSAQHAITYQIPEGTPTFIQKDRRDHYGQQEWVGLPAEQVAELFPEARDKLANDDDGIVWANTQTVSYETNETNS